MKILVVREREILFIYHKVLTHPQYRNATGSSAEKFRFITSVYAYLTLTAKKRKKEQICMASLQSGSFQMFNLTINHIRSHI